MMAQPSLGLRVRPPRASRAGRYGECVATVVVERCAAGRGVAGLQLSEPGALEQSEYYVPFRLDESPALGGRDFAYAGLRAALERLRRLGVRRVVVRTDEREIVDELARRVQPQRELTMPYVMLGCALNALRNGQLVAVEPGETSELREKTRALSGAFAA